MKYLTAEEERTLIRQFRETDCLRARDRLLMSYMPLCKMVARKIFRSRPLPEDILQDAFIGMMTALDRFDPDKGFRFGTYAAWWIRAEIYTAIEKRTEHGGGLTGRKQRLGGLIAKARAKADRMAREAGTEGDENAIMDSMADILGMPRDAMERAMWSFNVASLNEPSAREPGLEVIDLIEGTTLDGEAQLIVAQSDHARQRVVDSLIAVLNDREANIVSQRLLDEGCSATLKVLGGAHGISGERVRQVEQMALKKMRKAAQRNRLHEQLDQMVG